MEFGMFHEFQALPGETAAQSFANSLAQVDAAERWGLDAMWLAELHFAPERSVLASPMILAATIAQRTERMKIGTAVQVLPLCHPLRLAEEVATVDQLSHGRLIFGVGRSGFAHTYKTYGVDYGESRERFTETLADPEARLHRGALLATRASTSPTRTSGWRPSPCSSRGPRSASPRPAPTPMSRWPSSAIRSSSPRAPAISPSWRRW